MSGEGGAPVKIFLAVKMFIDLAYGYSVGSSADSYSLKELHDHCKLWMCEERAKKVEQLIRAKMSGKASVLPESAASLGRQLFDSSQNAEHST